MRHILCFSFSNVRICCLLLVHQTWKVESFTNLNIKHLTDHRKSSLGSLIKATINYSHCSWCYNWLVVTDSNLTPGQEENIPAAWHWDPAGCLRELSSSSPLHREQIHRHITGKHIHATLHKKRSAQWERKRREREREGMRASALALYPSWGPALAAVCFKIIARCSQSTMDSGREGWGGRDFKSKHHRLIWAGSVHLPLGGRKEKNETKCKNMDAVFDWCASICNRLKCMSSNPDVHSHPEELHCWLLFIYNKKKKNHTFCMHGYARHKGRVHKGLRGSWGADCMEIKKKQE